MINSLNHTLKLKQLGTLLEWKQGKNEDNIKPRQINPHTFNNYFLTIAENTTHNTPAQTTDNNRNYEYYWDLTHRSPCPKVRFNNITTTKNE